jgi:hypothetical protein
MANNGLCRIQIRAVGLWQEELRWSQEQQLRRKKMFREDACKKGWRIGVVRLGATDMGFILDVHVLFSGAFDGYAGAYIHLTRHLFLDMQTTITCILFIDCK